MPDDNNSTASPTPSPTQPTPEPRRSIREVAEAAYDNLVEGGDGDVSAPAEEGDGQSSRPRDTKGRFVAADSLGETPGEADGSRPTQPRTEEITAPEAAAPPHPAPPDGSSREAPVHWSAQDREVYAKAPPDMQAWALRREAALEGDYQRKVQATAQAAQVVQAIAPVFQDPAIAASLQREGLTPVDAIGQWAGFHRRFMDPNPENRAGVMRELMQRSGLDPAAVWPAQTRPQEIPGLSEKDRADPAIKYITDVIGRLNAENQATRQALAMMQTAEADKANKAAVAVAREAIDRFANEKDERGQLKRPHFDRVAEAITLSLYANPRQTMEQAYQRATWADEDVRKELLTGELAARQQQEANIRARQAMRSNTRGITSPVGREGRPNGPLGLRATIEAAAEEVGL